MPIVPTNLLYDFAAEAAAPAQAYVAGEVPKAILVASAKSYAAAHHMAGGTVMALVSAAIMGAYRAMGRSRSSTSRSRGERSQRARPVERAPKRLAIAGSASGNKTAFKRTGRADTLSTGLEIVERPLRIRKSLKGDTPKSVWSSLRDLVTGKKILKNTFSFKMTSVRDKRGLMAIPIRHDANLPMSGTASGWTVGSQTVIDIPAADGFGDYSTMLKVPLQDAYGARPIPSAANVIIPRMNLPTLEQTSWDLNNMKLLPTDDLMKRIQNNVGAPGPAVVNSETMVQPVVQLGGSAVPYNANQADENGLPNNYPSASTSYARKQSVYAPTGDPVKAALYSMPRFKTQIGGGSLKMRMCNQGTNSCTVEFVVVKVANPYLSTFDPTSAVDVDQITAGGAHCNMTKTWANLYDTVGWEHSKKVQSNLSYKMGEKNISLEDLQLEPINNPYKPWLPDSCFKGHYDNTNQYGATSAPYDSGGLYHDQGSTGVPTTDATNPLSLAPWNQQTGEAIPFNKTGGGGQKTPYRVVNRGHCTIAGAAERDVTIPFPGSNYDAAKIQSIAQTVIPGTPVDGVYNALCSDESYIVLVSINGSLQDIIEPQIDPTTNESTGTIKVIGKAYTASTVDFYCQYTETVYPSHCDYAAMGPVAYNVGSARTGMLKSSLDAYPGKVMPMADAVPVTQAGVLRTGASDRAGDNAGSIS